MAAASLPTVRVGEPRRYVSCWGFRSHAPRPTTTPPGDDSTDARCATAAAAPPGDIYLDYGIYNTRNLLFRLPARGPGTRPNIIGVYPALRRSVRHTLAACPNKETNKKKKDFFLPAIDETPDVSKALKSLNYTLRIDDNLDRLPGNARDPLLSRNGQATAALRSMILNDAAPNNPIIIVQLVPETPMVKERHTHKKKKLNNMLSTCARAHTSKSC